MSQSPDSQRDLQQQAITSRLLEIESFVHSSQKLVQEIRESHLPLIPSDCQAQIQQVQDHLQAAKTTAKACRDRLETGSGTNISMQMGWEAHSHAAHW